MAEFCLGCLRKMDGKAYTEKEVLLSREPDLCEGCAQYKPVVVRFRRPCSMLDWWMWWRR